MKQKKSRNNKIKKKSDTDLQGIIDMYEARIKKEQAVRYIDSDTLLNIIGEYMDSFILVGYDLTGAAIKIIHADTQKDKDAVSMLMNNLINEQSSGDEN